MVATVCTVCGQETPTAWERCGACGAQRVLHLDGTIGGYRRYAGFWRRALAVIVDLLIVAGPFALVLWLLPDRERLDLAVVGALAVVAYQMGLLAWSGDTWGKRLVRAHVVEDDGRPIGRGRVSAREGVAKILELVAVFTIFGGIGLIATTSDGWAKFFGVVTLVVGAAGVFGVVGCVFDGRRRTLHDRMAGTVCVRGRPVSPPARFTSSSGR